VTPKLTQLAVLIAVLGGFVLLTVRGQDTGTYVTLVTPVLAAVFLAARLDQRTDAQDAVLAKISHQTNGVLTERIQKAVHAALDARARDVPEPGE
jgi:hypothetical protein